MSASIVQPGSVSPVQKAARILSSEDKVKDAAAILLNAHLDALHVFKGERMLSAEDIPDVQTILEIATRHARKP